jgi:excisionase family DNA binding protein
MDLLTGEKRYNPKDIAIEFNVSHATVLRWIKNGDLKAVQYKGGWKVPETSLKMFIENSRST